MYNVLEVYIGCDDMHRVASDNLRVHKSIHLVSNAQQLRPQIDDNQVRLRAHVLSL